MKKFLLAAALATSAIVAAAPAQAVVINPGSEGLFFTSTASSTFVGTQGTLLASSTISGTTDTFAATMLTAVYRNIYGSLDFYYQVFRNGAGTDGDDEIRMFTAQNFGGYGVFGFVSGGDPDGGGFFAAASNPTPAGGSTTTTGRSPGNGNVLVTDFHGTGFNGLIGTENSATYIFRTTAAAFRPGTFGIIDGSTLDGVSFAPDAVPEPATWAMMIGGLGFVGAAMRRTRMVKTVTA